MNYTTEEIIEMIYDYKSNFTVYSNLMSEYNDLATGGGIAQYGEEAGMPKPQGVTSNVVLNEVQRRMKQDKMIIRYERKLRYIQNRWDRIIDEKQAIVFAQKLNGASDIEIARLLDCHRHTIKKTITQIAELLTD